MVSRSISHYHILKKLVAGGMGEVWLAEATTPLTVVVDGTADIKK